MVLWTGVRSVVHRSTVHRRKGYDGDLALDSESDGYERLRSSRLLPAATTDGDAPLEACRSTSLRCSRAQISAAACENESGARGGLTRGVARRRMESDARQRVALV